MTEREPTPAVVAHAIAELATEFNTSILALRTRWAKHAQSVHSDLRGSGLMVLQVVSRRGSVTSTDICHALNMDKSTVSRQVAMLRDLGMIDITPSAEDKRVTHLTLSAAGTAAISEMRERAAADYSARLAGWDPEEVAQLTALLHRFNELPPT